MEDMETSFTLFGQNLSTVHENDERSPALPTMSCLSSVMEFPNDEQRNAASDVLTCQALMSPDDSKPYFITLLEDETTSAYGRDGRKSKRAAFTSSRSRMSAVKKRSKICFEATTPLGSEKRVRRNLFTSNSNSDSVDVAGPLKSTELGNTDMLSVDASFCHSAGQWATTSLMWKKHASLPEPTRCQPTSKFPKSHSDAEMLISSALRRSNDDQNLIGDYSRPFRLPFLSGKHQDLKAISHETMADLLHGGCTAIGDQYIVVDCRYPYEYEAGHIRGARNIYSKEEIISQFLNSPSLPLLQKSPILIFHCEFSSERGPKLLRYLRNKDRSIHQENYPALYYPELYLLEGGYKEFCQWHMDLCEPNGYKPMLHKDHANELAYYRSKSRLYTSKESQALDAVTNNDRMERHKSTSLRC